ncbi:MAG: serine/threonine-protein kinase [Archangium sp.]
MATGGYCPACGKDWPTGGRCPDDGTQLVALKTVEDPLVGLDVDGRFTLRERLGRGGMGAVYRGYQHSVGRDVAVKVMTLGEGDETASKRFMREANLLGQLKHPGIVSVVDFGQLPDGRLYLMMELVDGLTLDDLVRREGPLPVERAVAIAVQVCDVLEVAHHRGIIHRDLKPSNVMVTPTPSGRDVVKVLDFGLARSLADSQRFTSSGLIVGSAQYLAPEVVGGGDATAAADLYALGGILFWLLSGELPFGSKASFTEVFHLQVMNKLGQLPPLPPALDRLVRVLLDPSPDRRPASAAIVREMLVANGQPTTEPSNIVKPPPRRLPVVIGVSAVVGMAAVFAVRMSGVLGPTDERVDSGTVAVIEVPRVVDAGVDASVQADDTTLDAGLEPVVDSGAPIAVTPTVDAGHSGKRRDAGVSKKRKRDAGPSDEMPGDWVP